MANITVSVTGVGGTGATFGFSATPTPSNVTATGATGSPVVQTSLPVPFIVKFTTTQDSTLVTVDHTSFGSITGDTVVLSEFTFGTGIYEDLVALLNGEHVLTALTGNQYTFNLPSPSPHSVVSSGEATVEYEISIGLDIATGGVGWGAGGYAHRA